MYKVSLKKTLSGERSFVLWKLTYKALCKFFPFWLRFSAFWGNFVKDFFQWFGLLSVGRSVFKAYYLPNILIYWNLVLIIFSKFQSMSRKVMEGNDNLWTFLKKHCLCSGNFWKIKYLLIQKPWIYYFVQESKFSNLLYQ